MGCFVGMYAAAAIIVANIIGHQVAAHIRLGSGAVTQVHIQDNAIAITKSTDLFPGNQRFIVVYYIVTDENFYTRLRHQYW